MSNALYDSIARIARHEVNTRAAAGVGRVTEVFTQGDHAVTVEMRDTGLVVPRVPVAVGVMGYAAIPAVDDLVVVAFMEGDYNAPVVVGRLYHPDQAPPDYQEDQIVLRVPSGGPKINLEVEGKTPSITLSVGDDVQIEIVKDGVTVTVGDMKIEATNAGGGRAEVTAGGSSIVLKKDSDVSVTSKTKLKLEAPEIEISGTAKVKVSGGLVEVN